MENPDKTAKEQCYILVGNWASGYDNWLLKSLRTPSGLVSECFRAVVDDAARQYGFKLYEEADEGETIILSGLKDNAPLVKRSLGERFSFAVTDKEEADKYLDADVEWDGTEVPPDSIELSSPHLDS